MSYVTVAQAEEIPDGEGRAYALGEKEIAIFNCGGSYYAVDNICSHEYAQLHEGYFDSDDCSIECPLHGSLFDLRTGQARTLPATRPVAVYQVRLEGTEIQVALD